MNADDSTTGLTAEDCESLRVFTERSSAGQHFTEVFSDACLQALEQLGLIEIHRPTHLATGMQYSEQYWHANVTLLGSRVVQAYERGYNDAVDQIQESIDCNCSDPYSVPAGGWDSHLVEAIGQQWTCQAFGQDPEESRDGWSPVMQHCLQGYAFGGKAASDKLREEALRSVDAQVSE